MAYTIEFVVGELQRLLEMQVHDRDTLNDWYGEARRLQDALAASGPPIPHFHFIMHFLIDADTRLKDADYRAAQEQRLRTVIHDLSD